MLLEDTNLDLGHHEVERCEFLTCSILQQGGSGAMGLSQGFRWFDFEA